jgi:hypothetical protein
VKGKDGRKKKLLVKLAPYILAAAALAQILSVGDNIVAGPA